MSIKRAPSARLPMRLRSLETDEINWGALDLIRTRPDSTLPIRDYLTEYKQIGEQITERYKDTPFDTPKMDLQHLACRNLSNYAAEALRAIDRNDAIEVASLMKAMYEPIISAFADQQKAAALNKNSHAKCLAYFLARKIWWDADREIPEPRSTEGCEDIARMIEQDDLPRFQTETIKGWLNRKKLIPDSAKRPGRAS